MDELHSPMHGLVCANVIKLILKGLPEEIRGLLVLEPASDPDSRAR